MAFDKLQASRFELKYVISEELALQIRDVVQSCLELDEYGVGRPNFSYPVHSLYLDSDDLKLHWMTINGTKNRFKLRVRFYSDDPQAPVFFEIKRRMNNCILKQRAPLRRSAVETMLAGQMPHPDTWISKEAKHEVALIRFLDLMEQINAKPKAHVAYLREAYLPHDGNSARLTMDREVRIEPEFTGGLSTHMQRPTLVWDRAVILELKFTDRFPNWFGDLVRRFHLRTSGAAKYVDGVLKVGENLFSPAHVAAGAPATL